MTIRLRTAFFIFLGIIILWLFYIEREILTPFLLAGIFAYILNPIVDFISDKIKLPRSLSVIIIYVVITAGLIAGGLALSKRIIDESSEVQKFISSITTSAALQINTLPDWIRPTAQDILSSLNKSKLFALSPSLLSFFPQAISRIVSFVIFLFSAFFFLKEGRRIIDRFLNQIPNTYKVEVEILLRKINSVFGGYLRGQVLMVLLMSFVFFLILSIFNIKFAIILAIFAGIAEIVPFIGPIVATTVTGLVVFTTNASSFGFSPLQTTLGVVIAYIIVRQLQDYLVIPYIMGRITKLHPLVILFAVLSGGHMAGMLGLILAVPVAAILKILLEFCIDKINDSSRKVK